MIFSSLSCTKAIMLYLLPITTAVQLKNEFKQECIVDFQSAKLDLKPQSLGANQIDNTSINLLSSKNDVLLHVSIRRAENAIVFNAHEADQDWGKEERVQLEGRFTGPDTVITVVDHGDRYQILTDYRTAHYFTKRIKMNANQLSYMINKNQISPFSDTLACQVYGSFADIRERSSKV
ncbi:galectin [Hygrophoropsis aurantiaca]|uniref:Galectin n=1 Tax=Hygrophoropsis aurantiaca TaxID=72124 RepID=A0ACB8A3T6_9AGAM|nr:galectin [Hygrophoropsis aurantiaca]